MVWEQRQDEKVPESSIFVFERHDPYRHAAGVPRLMLEKPLDIRGRMIEANQRAAQGQKDLMDVHPTFIPDRQPPITDLVLPSGDGVGGGDFESGFYLDRKSLG